MMTEPNDRALVVVDVQNDFCPGGTLPVEHGDEVAALISGFIARRANSYRVIVATKDWHPANQPDFAHFSETPDFKDTWPPHCVQGTPGAEFHDNFDASMIRHVFYKGQTSAAYSGFEGINDFREDLQTYLHTRGITAVDVVGLATDYCVYATAVDSAKNGYETTVLLDLTAAVHPESVEAVSYELMEAGVALADALN